MGGRSLGEEHREAQAKLKEARAAEAKRAASWSLWAGDAYSFLTGTDPDTGAPVYWTKDEKDPLTPVKAFPTSKPYVALYLATLRENAHVLVDKPRQMFITHSTCGFIHHDCLFRESRRWLYVKNKYDEAAELLRDKILFSYDRLPEWVRERVPRNTALRTSLELPENGSYIKPIASNAAEADIRGGTGDVVVDEAARQPEFRAMFAAALPMGCRFIGLTTPQVGNDGAMYFRELIEEGREG